VTSTLTPAPVYPLWMILQSDEENRVHIGLLFGTPSGPRRLEVPNRLPV